MIRVTQCPVCDATDLSDYLSCTDFTVSHETFTLKKCNSCFLVITTPRPEDSSLSKYYQSESYISHSSKGQTIIEKIYLFVRSFSLKWKLRLVTTRGEDTNTKSILDYGCGTGDFLKVCLNNGWKIQGVEPSHIASRRAIQTTNSEVLETINELKPQRFNTITLWHVLEHVPDLNALIPKLVSHLEENGTLFIAVPNNLSYDAKTYDAYWAGYDVPRHLWHFSKRNMTKLLSRNSLTLQEIVPMKLDAYYVSMLSEKYKNKGTVTPISLLRAFITGFNSNLKAKKNGAYSSLIYIAKKTR